MHVTQLPDVLLFGAPVEIVKALLPDRSGFEVGTPTHPKGRMSGAPTSFANDE